MGSLPPSPPLVAGTPGCLTSACVASHNFLPYSVNGGFVLKSNGIPLLPQTPERSLGLNAWPSTLYLSLAALMWPLFWHRGQVFQPGPAVTSFTSSPGSFPITSCADAAGANAINSAARPAIVNSVYRMRLTPDGS